MTLIPARNDRYHDYAGMGLIMFMQRLLAVIAMQYQHSSSLFAQENELSEYFFPFGLVLLQGEFFEVYACF